MDVSRIRALRGPNLWSRHTAIQAIVTCTGNELAIARLPGFETRLRARFPELGELIPTDHLDSDPQERAFARVATPMAKFFNCSRAPSIAYEALQCHGGNGFIEENPMARLYREAPLNSVWEGTANMMCMDVRRALQRDAGCVDALFAELAPLAGQHAQFDALVAQTHRLVHDGLEDEYLARPMTEAIARVLQGAELLRHSPAEVGDAFLATRSGAIGSASTCSYTWRRKRSTQRMATPASRTSCR